MSREVRTRASLGTLPRTENEEQLRAAVASMRTELIFRKVEDFLIQLVDVSKREYTLSELFPQYFALLPNRFRNQFRVASEADASKSADEGESAEQPTDDGEAERSAG